MSEIKVREKITPLWKVLYNNVWLIIIATIVCALFGFIANVVFSKPIYTATQEVMLRMEIKESSTNQSSDNATLAQTYLEDVSNTITGGSDLEKIANESYGYASEIRKENISVTVGEKSMIFFISYNDYDKQLAKEKLEQVIDAAEVVLDKENTIEAENISLVRTMNSITISKSTKTTTYVAVGAVVGLVLSVMFAILANMFDNTVKDIDEFEEMTGTSLLSHVEK